MAAHDDLDSILDAERAEARAERRAHIPDDPPSAAETAGLRVEREPSPVEPPEDLDNPSWRDA